MEDILQRLPHRQPFVMIDAVSPGDGGVTAEFLIKADNVLVCDGFFSESGLIENMAQAAGAGLPRPSDGSAPSLGYIGALRDLRIERLPRPGDTILTTVRYLNQVLNVHLAQASVHDGSGGLLASGELKIFLQPAQ
jgi:3-hydroxymyristoyl/3-hydroxydecanoyl-(acyl carrier protein) dehydratase